MAEKHQAGLAESASIGQAFFRAKTCAIERFLEVHLGAAARVTGHAAITNLGHYSVAIPASLKHIGFNKNVTLVGRMFDMRGNLWNTQAR